MKLNWFLEEDIIIKIQLWKFLQKQINLIILISNMNQIEKLLLMRLNQNSNHYSK